jgi:hypothetical protein
MVEVGSSEESPQLKEGSVHTDFVGSKLGTSAVEGE